MIARRLATAVITMAAVVPASALGSQAAPATVAPTPAEGAAIVKAFGDPIGAAPCLIVRLAAANNDYATVRFRARIAVYGGRSMVRTSSFAANTAGAWRSRAAPTAARSRGSRGGCSASWACAPKWPS